MIFNFSPLPETGAIHIHHKSPMGDPVKKSSSEDRIMEDFDPFREHQVRGNNGTGCFMA